MDIGNQINEQEEEEEEVADFDENENEEDNGETPAALLNNQSKYVMSVNSSKLARKPYYKLL